MGQLFLLIGPSGSGKTTLAQDLRKFDPSIQKVLSATTRSPRKNEINGKDYLFASKGEFAALLFEHKLLECEEVHGNFYGMLTESIDSIISSKNIGISVIDPMGGLKMKQRNPYTVTTIFVSPAGTSELERRLLLRASESDMEIITRLERARFEMKLAGLCDYQIFSTSIENDLALLKSIAQSKIIT